MNGRIDTEIGGYLREVIGQHVSNDKETYNEAMLGRTNPEYCEWIRKPSSWGGAIEVSILSNYYGIEIDVVDITNALINRFGEDKEYGMRVFLLFDGIHYDPLYLESVTVWKKCFSLNLHSLQREKKNSGLKLVKIWLIFSSSGRSTKNYVSN